MTLCDCRLDLLFLFALSTAWTQCPQSCDSSNINKSMKYKCEEEELHFYGTKLNALERHNELLKKFIFWTG